MYDSVNANVVTFIGTHFARASVSLPDSSHQPFLVTADCRLKFEGRQLFPWALTVDTTFLRP